MDVMPADSHPAVRDSHPAVRPGARGAATATAPAKVILTGEHAVNRGQAAVATALELRVACDVVLRGDGRYGLSSGDRAEAGTVEELAAFRARVDALRSAEALDAIRALAGSDYFAPVRYVLSQCIDGVGGVDVTWRSELPIGAGFGSGSAASASLVVALAAARGTPVEPADVASLAWSGDVIAHGGVASGLDSGACALGGAVRYTLERGPEPLALGVRFELVVADTGIVADTATVNAAVRERLAARPWLGSVFPAIGWLSEGVASALGAGDLAGLGSLLNLNQLALERLGVSCPEIDALVEAALAAGAWGAKLSGSGGGGIVLAVAEPRALEAVADAMAAAGAGSLVVTAGVEGARAA